MQNSSREKEVRCYKRCRGVFQNQKQKCVRGWNRAPKLVSRQSLEPYHCLPSVHLFHPSIFSPSLCLLSLPLLNILFCLTAPAFLLHVWSNFSTLQFLSWHVTSLAHQQRTPFKPDVVGDQGHIVQNGSCGSCFWMCVNYWEGGHTLIGIDVPKGI